MRKQKRTKMNYELFIDKLISVIERKKKEKEITFHQDIVRLSLYVALVVGEGFNFSNRETNLIMVKEVLEPQIPNEQCVEVSQTLTIIWNDLLN